MHLRRCSFLFPDTTHDRPPTLSLDISGPLPYSGATGTDLPPKCPSTRLRPQRFSASEFWRRLRAASTRLTPQFVMVQISLISLIPKGDPSDEESDDCTSPIGLHWALNCGCSCHCGLAEQPNHSDREDAPRRCRYSGREVDLRPHS